MRFITNQMNMELQVFEGWIYQWLINLSPLKLEKYKLSFSMMQQLLII